MMVDVRPIGVFDSGVGGLTVLKALREALPQEDFIYLGDTARLPYGTKGADTVADYALQAARFLMAHDIKLLVVACNTATALALPQLQKHLPDLPCLGVIAPGAKRAAEASKKGHIAVLSTEGTARSGAYAKAILHHRPDAMVQSLGCNLLVALAEEGWCEGSEAEAVIARYLGMLKQGYDTLVLGCTHFPLLAPTLRRMVGADITLIDSATATAEAVHDYMAQSHLANMTHHGVSRFFVTDLPERFRHLAQRFLGCDATDIALTDLRPDVPQELRKAI